MTIVYPHHTLHTHTPHTYTHTHTHTHSDPSAVNVTFNLSEELSHQTDPDQPPLPTKHRVVMQSLSSQSLSVFSEGEGGGQVVAEGKVSQRADIQPLDSAAYMKLKQ